MISKIQKISIGIVAILMLIPAIAMQYTKEVNWTILDFMVMGTLLLITSLVIEYSLKKIKNSNYKIVIIFGIVLVFLAIWAELAVGLFNSPFAGS